MAEKRTARSNGTSGGGRAGKRATVASRPGPQSEKQRAVKDQRAFAKYAADKHALRARMAKGAGPAAKKVLSLSIQDEQNMATSLDGYRELAALRRAAYREHAKAAKLDPAIAALVTQLVERFGPKVKVWHNVVDWLSAILISRYGEAIEHWPATLTVDDARRIRHILSSRQPMLAGVTPLGHIDAAKLRALASDNLRAIETGSALLTNVSNETPTLYLGIDDSED